VLAVGSDGKTGLWALGPDERWSVVAPAPGATALGRSPDDVAVAVGGEIEVSHRPEPVRVGECGDPEVARGIAFGTHRGRGHLGCR